MRTSCYSGVALGRLALSGPWSAAAQVGYLGSGRACVEWSIPSAKSLIIIIARPRWEQIEESTVIHFVRADMIVTRLHVQLATNTYHMLDVHWRRR